MAKHTPAPAYERLGAKVFAASPGRVRLVTRARRSASSELSDLTKSTA
jgi:hypothetical protein